MENKLTQPVLDIINLATGLLKGDYDELATEEQRHDLEAIYDSAEQHLQESKEIWSVVERDDVYMLVELSDQRLGPLNAITGFCWFLLEDMSGPLTQRQVEAIETLRDKTDFLLKQFHNVWEYARIKSGAAMWMKPVYFDFQSRIVDTSDVPADVQCVFPKRLPWVYADEIYVKRSFINLVENAVQFCPDGQKIIRAQFDEGHVMISIQDDGVGINDQHLGKIFEPFWQANDKYPGLGLGLFIAKSHLERMRGTLYVESAPDHGAAFTFTLPILPD